MQAAIISFRLGGTDGVSVEAEKWSWALQQLGYDVRRIAGDIPSDSRADDLAIPSLSAYPSENTPDPTLDMVSSAIEGADLVIAENICSLPMNLDVSRVVTGALKKFTGRIILRHHDVASQREHFAHLSDELPPHIPGALHATINELTRQELLERGFDEDAVVVIHNYFDLAYSQGNRDATRQLLGMKPEDLLIWQPGRAIPRKNVGGGMAFAAALQQQMPDRKVQYWISGPAEDGFEAEFEAFKASAEIPVMVRNVPSAADAYAACDVVLFPSTWEGFGNPTIEAAIAQKPLVVAGYPILSEITQHGFEFFSIAHPSALADFLHNPDKDLLTKNRSTAEKFYGLEKLPIRLNEVLSNHNWETH